MKSADVWFRAVLCLSTALMMVISWPLWVTAGEFPRVPWFGWVRLLAPWASWIRFVLALLAMVLAALWPILRNWQPLQKWVALPIDETPATDDNVSRANLGVALVLSFWMVLEDQFRLQPWMYQFLLMGLAVVACSRERAITLCRCFVIAQYFHSGLSKLDHEFVNDMGRWFLFYGAKALGFRLESWSGPFWDTVIAAMPCWELLIATAFIVRARRTGIAAAIALHIALIAILGPWGMNHSANVLIWNVAMIFEVASLFRQRPKAPPNTQSGASRIVTGVLTAVVAAAIILPLGERGGHWDTWPSFAVYASSNEAVFVAMTGDRNGFPQRVPINGWSEDMYGHKHVFIDVKAWSLKERRVPIYPSSRALNGVAEALGSRYRGRRDVLVSHSSRADRRTGNRQQVRLEGLDAVRKFGDTFWLNAHPAR